ncbi:Glycosylphosphatidylinositol anchor attachment 1 protein (GPI anchor attachment protein 1) (GAA1 protein homolog) (hGAA1) [Durusdinium trenchii]|uniref:Glycosylphosphatidylinositol anchor attachment 1 protein (GPI anchor attachment protein 1) (GAA1 protein homolog) (HGAA1) n=1 Tax=Durusdinium trenchii TaxID=1381693 RepID=A0ABP0Q6J2_9DINO
MARAATTKVHLARVALSAGGFHASVGVGDVLGRGGGRRSVRDLQGKILVEGEDLPRLLARMQIANGDDGDADFEGLSNSLRAPPASASSWSPSQLTLSTLPPSTLDPSTLSPCFPVLLARFELATRLPSRDGFPLSTPFAPAADPTTTTPSSPAVDRFLFLYEGLSRWPPPLRHASTFASSSSATTTALASPPRPLEPRPPLLPRPAARERVRRWGAGIVVLAVVWSGDDGNAKAVWKTEEEEEAMTGSDGAAARAGERAAEERGEGGVMAGEKAVDESEEEEEEEDEVEGSKLQVLVVKLASALSRRSRTFSGLFLVLGVVWVTLFPLVCITTGELKCRGTYFSENALSPGLARPTFRWDGMKHVYELERQIVEDGEGVLEDEALFEAAGLRDVRRHGAGQRSGVLYPRTGADRREAILIVCRSGQRDAALGLVLMRLLSEADWLSKNVLFLMAKSSRDVRDWVEAYHSGGVEANMTRAGVIVGGLVLDIGKPRASDEVVAIEVLGAGFNGLLPNLDLVNTVVFLLRPSQVPGEAQVRLWHHPKAADAKGDALDDAFERLDGLWASHKAGLVEPKYFKSGHQYLSRLHSQLRFMQNVAFGPTGWHAHLLPFDIHAVTLRVEYAASAGATRNAPTQTNKNHHHNTGSRRDPDRALFRIGKVVEQTVRSLSNLEEKFHQSYFLYVLPDLNLFVSIGEYSGSLALVLSPLLLQVLRHMERLGNDPGADDMAGVKASVINLLAVATGAALFAVGPQVLGDQDRAATHTMGGVVAVCLAGASAIVFVVRKVLVHHKAKAEELLWERAVALMQLGVVVVHAQIGMVDYPFALLSALTTVPVVLVCTTVPKLGPALRLGVCLVTVVPWWVWALWDLVPMTEDWPSATQDPLRALQSMHAEFGLMHWAFLCWVHLPVQLVMASKCLAEHSGVMNE